MYETFKCEHVTSTLRKKRNTHGARVILVLQIARVPVCDASDIISVLQLYLFFTAESTQTDEKGTLSNVFSEFWILSISNVPEIEWRVLVLVVFCSMCLIHRQHK